MNYFNILVKLFKKENKKFVENKVFTKNLTLKNQ